MLTLIIPGFAEKQRRIRPTGSSTHRHTCNRLGMSRALTARWTGLETELATAFCGLRGSGTVAVEWIADRPMHRQLITNLSNDQKNLALQRFNPKSKRYELWTFHPDSSGYYLGSWNDRCKTMTWDYVDFGAGIRGTIVDCFTREGNWQQTAILKDNKKNVLLDIQIEHTPIEQNTK